MYVIHGTKVLSYIRFTCKDKEKEITIDIKSGDIISIELSSKKTYTGKVTNVNVNNFTLDCSAMYQSNVITTNYSEVVKVNKQ